MGSQEYKIKVEYGVSAVVLLIGFFFIFQAFTIETSKEAVGRGPCRSSWRLRWSSVVFGSPSVPLPGGPVT